MSEKWNMIIDVARCENCHNCTLATKDETVENDFPGYSAPQPRHGHEWIKLTRKVRGRNHLVDTAYLPSMCNHCDDAPCVHTGAGCVSKRDDGLVIIDPQKAKGRRDLVDACPYGNIWWNEELDLPQHWTFDAHLLDQGWKEPRASQACPTGAMEAVKLTDDAMAARASRDGLETLPNDAGAKPRVWYRNLFRFTHAFLGGTVLHETDGVKDVVIDASVTLRRDGQKIAATRTDMFGDFKFDGLLPDGAIYEIVVSAPEGSETLSVALADTVVLDPIVLKG
ncbi:4Fe-4S dicluster domain-containing protein [Celeribacter baekdonensis]|uniref:Oxidoreductase n=1 Tax=Celeribacter baekdonensis TaxID=875171 RepID=A0A2R4M844_9RHOB|nr:4Fe-4S dicluster domain-containing protein [Celeribacter baekdonensis]AVW93370.1 oxidoreductase [Celeribacter baekdonensis]